MTTEVKIYDETRGEDYLDDQVFLSRKFEEIYNSAKGTYPSELPSKTLSLCPVCRRIIPAVYFEENGELRMIKKCPEHGVFEDVIDEDVNFYNRSLKYAKTWAGSKKYRKVEFSMGAIENTGRNCPFDCGLCPAHMSHTALLNLVATNRCNLRCWYCFFYAKEGEPVYEPSLEQIRYMLKRGRELKPYPAVALQITGGEPTLREDLVDIVRIAKELGYTHIQLNTNGLKFVENPEYLVKLREAGVNTMYLSFDGVDGKTNWKNHWEVPYILEAARKAGGPGIVLVPTVIKGVNDDQVGDIINFALNHLDIIRAVNFQPVSLVGMMLKNKEIRKYRITKTGVIKKIEEYTNGQIGSEDWYTVPTPWELSELIESLTGAPQFHLSTHILCGAGTYVFLGKDGKVVPITRFVDVEGFFEYIRELREDIDNTKVKFLKKLKAVKLILALSKFIDKEKQPKGLDLVRILKRIFVYHNYDALGEFHLRSLFIGMMHFQDLYNYDINRVRRCQIHYAMPDGRIVPFCAFNVIPEIYRDKVQEVYSIPWEEYKKMHPEIDLEKEVYRRDPSWIKDVERSELYRRTYIEIKNFFK